jgi:7-cyano-7-deazaguanine synthase
MADAGPCVVLLSGGLDSVTTLAVARSRGLAAHAMSFAYGQRHAVELGCATRQARALGAVAHEVVDLAPLGRLVSSATALVAGSELAVPKDRELDDASEIPSTYVPARNTVFLSYALSWAEVLGARSIFIGVNALDYSGYPDCRPAFVAAFEAMANLATRAADDPARRLTIETPLVSMAKHEIIALGTELGVDYTDTVSCYDPVQADDGAPIACGRCDSCGLRARGFERAGVPDPTRYT